MLLSETLGVWRRIVKTIFGDFQEDSLHRWMVSLPESAFCGRQGFATVRRRLPTRKEQCPALDFVLRPVRGSGAVFRHPIPLPIPDGIGAGGWREGGKCSLWAARA